MAQFKKFWSKLNNGSLSPEEKARIDKHIMKSTDPWAVCTSEVGRGNKDKYEDCVNHVKQSMASKGYFNVNDQDEQDQEIHPRTAKETDNWDKALSVTGTKKEMGTAFAGPVPESLLAAQDLETTEKSERVYGEDRYSEAEALADLKEMVNGRPNWTQAYVDYDADKGTYHACITCDESMGKSFKKNWAKINKK